MGCGSSNASKQVLLSGLESAGKTTLLYNYKFDKKQDFKSEPTIGFNYEEIREKDDLIGFWDVGGKETV